MDADVRGEGGPRIWALVCMTHFSKTAGFKFIPLGGGIIWKEDTGLIRDVYPGCLGNSL